MLDKDALNEAINLYGHHLYKCGEFQGKADTARFEYERADYQAESDKHQKLYENALARIGRMLDN